MKMINYLGCSIEIITGRMNKLTKSTRKEAIKSLDSLSGECTLQVGGKPYIDREGFAHLKQSSIENPLNIRKIKLIVEKSMNHWNKGYGLVYNSTGKTKEGNKRILIKHKIPGASIGGAGGPGYEFGYNNFYEVTEK